MPRIARVYRMRTPPCPTVTEAAFAKTCNPARLPDRRNLAAPHPDPARNEWAIGKLRPAHPGAIGALSAASGTAARHGRIATTAIRALAQPGAEAPRAAGCGAVVAAVCGVVAVEAAAAVVGTDRTEGKRWQK